MSEIDVCIEWPNLYVEFGPFSVVYDIEDLITIEGDKDDVSILEVTDNGLVIETENGTEFVDMRAFQENG